MASSVYRITHVSNAVASKYDERVIPHINKTIGLIGLMKEGKISYEGEDYFKIPWQNQMNESFAWQGEYDGTNNTLPDALLPGFEQMQLGWKKGILQFMMSDEMADIQKGAKNFVNILSRHMDDGITVMNKNLDAAVHGSGNGSLAIVVSYSGQVITFDTTKNLRPGMVLDTNTVSTDAETAGDIVLTSVDSTTTATFTGTVSGVVADDIVTHANTYDNTNGGALSPNGISNIVDDDDGDFQNQDREDFPQLEGNVVDGSTPATAEAFTFTRMRNVLVAIQRGDYGSKLESGSFWYGTPGGINAFSDKMHDENVPTATIPKFAGDTDVPAYQYGGIKFALKSSPQAVDDTLFLLNPNHLFKYFGKAQWKRFAGGVLLPVDGAPAVRGYRSQWINFGSDAPRFNGRLNDVTET